MPTYYYISPTQESTIYQREQQHIATYYQREQQRKTNAFQHITNVSNNVNKNTLQHITNASNNVKPTHSNILPT